MGKFKGYIIYCVIIIAAYSIPIGLLLGCSNENKTNEMVIEEAGILPTQGRIFLKHKADVIGTHFYIIEVDGQEYLAQYQGGIIKLEN